MPLTSDQRGRVRELFEAAVDRDPMSLQAWVAEQSADDPVVCAEVLSLLEHEARAGAFLSHPVAEHVPDLLTEDLPLSEGAVVGQYTVIRELGRGGMGRVYLASDARLGRTVALKALAPELTRDPLQRERLRREARAAAGLMHPGVCTVYALEEIEGDLFIVTEFVDGRTLRDEIRSGRQPSADAILRTARELSGALASAHAHGITHRDLKPENVMRASDGRLKVLDFGLARLDEVALSGTPAAAVVTQPGVLLGTPAYMAPEQLNGETPDARADVFAFGVVLYEYSCGVHPFDAPTALARVARVLESGAPPLAARAPHVPAGVVDVIDRCLRKSPGERFRSAGEIAAALEQAGAASGSPSHRRWWRVHQLIVLMLYIVATALGWQIKEWIETPFTVSMFVGLGIAATISGVLRGHLLFTEFMNGAHLERERRRTSTVMTVIDVLMAAALAADAALLAGSSALPAVLSMSLALGIALAALVLEPATNRATFGD